MRRDTTTTICTDAHPTFAPSPSNHINGDPKQHQHPSRSCSLHLEGPPWQRQRQAGETTSPAYMPAAQPVAAAQILRALGHHNLSSSNTPTTQRRFCCNRTAGVPNGVNKGASDQSKKGANWQHVPKNNPTQPVSVNANKACGSHCCGSSSSTAHQQGTEVCQCRRTS